MNTCQLFWLTTSQNTETILRRYCRSVSVGMPFWQKYLLCIRHEVYLVPTPIEHNVWLWDLKKARLPTQYNFRVLFIKYRVYKYSPVLTYSVTNLQRNVHVALFVGIIVQHNLFPFGVQQYNKMRTCQLFWLTTSQNTETILRRYCRSVSVGMPFWQKYLLCIRHEVYLVPTPIEHNVWLWDLKRRDCLRKI